MLLAEFFHTPVEILKEQITPFSYKVYQAHLEWRWNNPDRICYYLMRVGQLVAQKFADHPEKITLEDIKIPFSFEGQSKPPEKKKEQTPSSESSSPKERDVESGMTREQADAAAKARFFAATGFNQFQAERNRRKQQGK